MRAKGLFGKNFDTLCTDVIDDEFNNYQEVKTDSIAVKDEFTLDEILDSSFKYGIIEDEKEDVDSEIKSIIDFPNFLMHVLRLYATYVKETENTVSLNADNMPLEKPDFITDSMDFIKVLLQIRVLFDRYVVKIQGDDDIDDEGNSLRWRLLRPTRYEYQKNGKIYYRVEFINTFSSKLSSDNDELDDINNRIVKLESMLQVTFKSPKYKDWLYALISWLYGETKENRSIKYESMLNKLENWTHDYFKSLPNEYGKEKKL